MTDIPKAADDAAAAAVHDVMCPTIGPFAATSTDHQDYCRRISSAAVRAALPYLGEPVAYRWRFDADASWSFGIDKPQGFRFGDPEEVQPLYLAPPVLPAPAVKVRPLEWTRRREYGLQSGWYYIDDNGAHWGDERYRLTRHTVVIGSYPTEEAAKEAAQDDHEAVILSALATDITRDYPSGGNIAVAEMIGWLFFNPDTGTEFSPSHPVDSGECPDAEQVREATAANLLAELTDAWGAVDHAAMTALEQPVDAIEPAHGCHQTDLPSADRPRVVRHKKRGSTYEVIGVGKMQAERWYEYGFSEDRKAYVDKGLVDMREVTIYRAIDDGSIWVRPVEEFIDGRFEEVDDATLASASLPPVDALVETFTREEMLAEMAEALRPFAAEAAAQEARNPDAGDSMPVVSVPTIGQCRAAAAALAAYRGRNGGLQ